MQTKMQAESRLLNWGSAAALLLLFAVSLSVGVADFSWRNLFAMPDEWQLLLTSRLPRTFAIVLTGASMAVAGMILQILMKNRFIEPSMVGATQSASLGLLLMVLLFPAATLMVKMSVAAAAALAGMLVFMLLIRRLPPAAQLMVPLQVSNLKKLDAAGTYFVVDELPASASHHEFVQATAAMNRRLEEFDLDEAEKVEDNNDNGEAIEEGNVVAEPQQPAEAHETAAPAAEAGE